MYEFGYDNYQRESLDEHITGNYGEDQLSEKPERGYHKNIKCPQCEGGTRVTNSRGTGKKIRRNRLCENGHTFGSTEVIGS